MHSDQLDTALHWQPPAHWRRVRSLDAHTGGEPLRIYLEGYGDIPGATILDKQAHCRDQLDALRRATVWEPRGHADMYGCIVTEATTPDGDFGVIFTHNEGYSSMCGHGIIAVTTALLETGVLPVQCPETCLRIDAPAGRITAHARIQNQRVASVYFHNVPSYVVELDAQVAVPELGTVRYDLAFGGAYYAFVDARELGLDTGPDNAAALIRAGRAIKGAVMASRRIEHPEDPALGFLYGTIFIDAPRSEEADSRNVCIFADGELDRSPTGTGVSARAAIHHARGELKAGESMQIESIVGSRFRTCVQRTVDYCGHPAVIPEVEGQAFITGRHEFLIDPADPFAHGFFIR
ncbi:proline racemase family protein [Parahaliea aestuarii]|uniref:Proline racemase n=1 Tax=Parahaliea aestuarii TaxID=1852021 RepID=A0A5C8ZVD4_9GAMM|nr:proline racemase family protein [Parahaliea aestuarii]TXS92483.1 proline racemase [Parahaliea aestuarii]